MLAICSGNRYTVVLGLAIQYLSGKGTFPGRVSPGAIISYSNVGGRCGQSSWAVVVGGRRGRSSWAVVVGGRRGRSSWAVVVGGRRGRSSWAVVVGGRRGRSSWAVVVGGRRGRSSWAVVVGGRRGRSSRPPRRPHVSCEHAILLENTTLTPRI